MTLCWEDARLLCLQLEGMGRCFMGLHICLPDPEPAVGQALSRIFGP